MNNLVSGAILNNTYQIIEEIGAGGGGVVFKARHLRLQTDVVVKKIKDEVRGKINIRQEADILKNLKHPYLPRIYDFIETSEAVYTVMDYIDGEDLESAVKRHGKFSQKLVRKWAEQLGEALAYLHNQNPPIIHSDIKPANVMLTRDGNVCLIDFNISLAIGNGIGTAVGISAGFSPPEQYKDINLFLNIAKNYTQKLVVSRKNDFHQQNVDERTVLLSNIAGERTFLLSNQRDEGTMVLNNQSDDGTVLLSNQSDDGTVLLSNQSDEETVLLSNQKDEGTIVLNNQGDERTVFLNNQDDEGTVLLNNDIHSYHMLQSTYPVNTSKYTQYIGRGIDVRSDIYSLGATLWFLLNGEKPPIDILQIDSVSNLYGNLSEGFAVIIDKMMEISPEKRYQNGEEFLKAIRNCYKYDRRYLSMHRKECMFYIASLCGIVIGSLLVGLGIYRVNKENNQIYYDYITQAQYNLENANYEHANALIQEAKLFDSTRADAYVKEIQLLYVTGNYEECILKGDEYIQAAPYDIISDADYVSVANICYIVGNAYFDLSDMQNAIFYLKAAISYDAYNAQCYRDYAIALAKNGQLDEAHSVLKEGVDRGLAQDSIYMAQGEIEQAKGNYEEALLYFEKVINNTEDVQLKKRAVLLCADVYRTLGVTSLDKEIELLEKYTKEFKNQGNFVFVEYLASAYSRKAQEDILNANYYYKSALDLFQKLYDDGYATYNLRQNMAILYETMDDFDSAEKILLQLADEYPAKYEVYKRLAFLEADRQQMKENRNRNYYKMLEYYNIAVGKCSPNVQDVEMEMLSNMIRDLEEGGWFS